MAIHQHKILRRIIIPLLKKLNPGKISIRHHYTKARIVLDAFNHKGYWYHGRNREVDTMELFRKLIQPGMTVIEVGGHIGYITNYFSHLVGQKGKVYVFEPGENNLPYIKENIQKLTNVELVQKAVSDTNGTARFYVEDLSGQNNSLLSDYGVREDVQKMAFVEEKIKVVEVETVTLDSFCADASIVPNFVKIDIEGAELLALNGMKSVLRDHAPMMMIEITENWDYVSGMLESLGYQLLNVKGSPINSQTHQNHHGNTFCLHSVKHRKFLSHLVALKA
jgi:FkbM family methyltransferase